MAEVYVDVVVVVDPLDVPEVRFDEQAFPSWPVSVRFSSGETTTPLVLRFGSELQLQRWALAIAGACRRRAGPPPEVVRDDGELPARIEADGWAPKPWPL